MEQRLTPEVFYGAAIAALIGLVFGLLLHIGWEKHPGGPQILFSAAEAAEPVRPAIVDGAEVADLDASPVEPTPLPVVRLHPEMFDVKPAAADEIQRQDAGETPTEDASGQTESAG
jgi:hypothetical protein